MDKDERDLTKNTREKDTSACVEDDRLWRSMVKTLNTMGFFNHLLDGLPYVPDKGESCGSVEKLSRIKKSNIVSLDEYRELKKQIHH